MSNASCFALLNQEQRFNLDPDQIEQAYIHASKTVHPDLFPNASSREKLDLTLKSAALNQAYETLKNPLKRGYALLNEKAPHLDADQEKTIRDPELLAQTFEDQETLDEITSVADLESFDAKVKDRCKSTLEQIQVAFEGADFNQALLQLYRYRYHQKLQQDVVQKRRALS